MQHSIRKVVYLQVHVRVGTLACASRSTRKYKQQYLQVYVTLYLVSTRQNYHPTL